MAAFRNRPNKKSNRTPSIRYRRCPFAAIVRVPFHFRIVFLPRRPVMYCVSNRPWLMASLVAALGIGGPAAAQAVGEEPATDTSRTFKRLDRLGAAELRKQLQEFPEVGL